MPRRATLRVLIAHTEPIVRYGLRSLIEKEADIHVLAEEADDGPSTLRMARELRPDVAVIRRTSLIRDAAQHTAVIVIAGDNEEAAALPAIRAGAAAYLLRDCQLDDVLRAIRGVAAGQTVLPRAAARLVDEDGSECLSGRELEVLRLVGRGMSNKHVANALGITLSTVKSHVSTMLGKLGLSSRTQLALYVTRGGPLEKFR
ncbi:MAG: response regulator transcription factor [Chloroflexi bacterium]|nr:response regulator transcription factor [Chloroflexota bacterium]